MGTAMGKVFSQFSKQQPTRIVMLGLDAAGKTTIFYAMKLGEVVTTIPTIGFNVETVEYKNLTLTAWDVGGRDKIRPLWRHYFQNTSAIVFVVDSNDAERMEEAKDELHRMLREDELRNVPVLIFANKQDLPNALSPQQVSERLEVTKLEKSGHETYVQSSCAVNKEGLLEGFQWLTKVTQPKTNVTEPIVETIKDSVAVKNDLFSIWDSMRFKTLAGKFI